MNFEMTPNWIWLAPSCGFYKMTFVKHEFNCSGSNLLEQCNARLLGRQKFFFLNASLEKQIGSRKSEKNIWNSKLEMEIVSKMNKENCKIFHMKNTNDFNVKKAKKKAALLFFVMIDCVWGEKCKNGSKMDQKNFEMVSFSAFKK